MKLNYCQLLDPSPLYLKNIGHIHKPTVQDIFDLEIENYNTYLAYLIMTPLKFCETFYPDLAESYHLLSDKEKEELTLFNLVTESEEFIQSFLEIFNFFFQETVQYNVKKNSFELIESFESDKIPETQNVVGYITKTNFSELCNILLQINNIERPKNKDEKPKNALGLYYWNKIQKYKKKQKKFDDKYDFGNIVSIVAAYGEGLNILNITQVTVYQLYDQFQRIQVERAYRKAETSISVWGDKENTFKHDMLYENIYNH